MDDWTNIWWPGQDQRRNVAEGYADSPSASNAMLYAKLKKAYYILAANGSVDWPICDRGREGCGGEVYAGVLTRETRQPPNEFGGCYAKCI